MVLSIRPTVTVTSGTTYCFHRFKPPSRVTKLLAQFDDLLEVADYEGKELAVPARGIGIDAHHGLVLQILQRVGDQAILPERHHCVVWTENEVGEERAINHLQPAKLR